MERGSGLLVPRFTTLARGARLTPERLDRLQIGKELWPKERELVVEMLFNREEALAWTFSEIGRIRECVTPPQEIRTVEHSAWQSPGFPVPRAL